MTATCAPAAPTTSDPTETSVPTTPEEPSLEPVDLWDPELLRDLVGDEPEPAPEAAPEPEPQEPPPPAVPPAWFRSVRPELAQLDLRDLDYAESLILDGEAPEEAARRTVTARKGSLSDRAYRRLAPHSTPPGRFSVVSVAAGRAESPFDLGGA